MRAAIRLFAVLGLLAALPPAPAEADVVARDVAEARALCRDAGGTPSIRPEFETRLDLTGDGRADVVLDYQAFDCAGAWTVLCSAVGCPLAIYVDDGAGHRRVGGGQVQAWSVDAAAAPPILTLLSAGAFCGRPLHEVCRQRLQWTGAGFAEPGAAAAPAPQRPPVDAAPSAAPGVWDLRPVPGRAPVATVAGPGVVESFSVLCFDGRPMAALVLKAPPPTPVLSLRAEGRRLEAELRRDGASGPWVAELSGSGIPALLSGRASSADISVSGAAQGRLSLRGSTAAIRGALAGCGGG